MTMPIDDIITSAEERGLVRVEAEEQAAEKTPATE